MTCPLGIVWRSPAGPTLKYQQYRRPLRFSQDDIWSLKVPLLPWIPFLQLTHLMLRRLRLPKPLGGRTRSPRGWSSGTGRRTQWDMEGRWRRSP